MTGTWRVDRAAVAWLRAPAPLLALGGALLLAAASSLRLGGVSGHFGVLATIRADADASLTYGIGAALVVAGLAAAAQSRLDGVLHASGVDPLARVSRGLLVGAGCGVAARIAVVLGAAAAGIVNTNVTAGPPVPVHGGLEQQLRGEARLVGIYLVAGLLGAAVGLICRRGFSAAAITTALVVPYLPAVGAFANRASSALDVLPYLPFGAVRATLSGNGAIFGQDSSQTRRLDMPTAAAIATAWFVLLVAVAVARRARLFSQDRVRLGAVGFLLAGMVGASGAGVALSSGHEVPWQWRPAWRHAREAGWSSDKVALRWADAVGSDASGVSGLFAPGRYVPLDREATAPLRDARSVRVSDLTRLSDPDPIDLFVTLDKPVVSGNVVVTEVGYRLTFVHTGSRYLIDSISGPAPTRVSLGR